MKLWRSLPAWNFDENGMSADPKQWGNQVGFHQLTIAGIEIPPYHQCQPINSSRVPLLILFTEAQSTWYVFGSCVRTIRSFHNLFGPISNGTL